MLDLHRWQAGPALVVALGVVSSAIAPLTFPAAATATPDRQTIAQLFPPEGETYGRQTIPAGTRIPVRYDKADKIVVAPSETSDVTLQVARNLRNTSGTLLVPAGSEIRGKLVPANGGSQFISDTLILPDGTTYPIRAESGVVTRVEEVRQTNGTAIAAGSVLGAGASAILFGVTGNRRISAGEVLAGAGVGALSGWLLGKKGKEVVVINPESDLTLTLTSGLTLR